MSHLTTQNGLKEMFSDTQLIANIAMVQTPKLKSRTMFKKCNNWLLVVQFMIWTPLLTVFLLNNTTLTSKHGLTMIQLSTFRTFLQFLQDRFAAKLP